MASTANHEQWVRLERKKSVMFFRHVSSKKILQISNTWNCAFGNLNDLLHRNVYSLTALGTQASQLPQFLLGSAPHEHFYPNMGEFICRESRNQPMVLVCIRCKWKEIIKHTYISPEKQFFGWRKKMSQWIKFCSCVNFKLLIHD